MRRQYFRESDNYTICSWKGTASYYAVVMNNQVNQDAAWYYPEPKEVANTIRLRSFPARRQRRAVVLRLFQGCAVPCGEARLLPGRP